MNFDEAFEKLIGHEGGYQCNPTDRGNWTGGKQNVGILRGTKYGISAAAYPGLDIHSLTLDDAKDIYMRDFWNRVIVPATPAVLRFSLFDMAVNSGVDYAIKTLQQTLSLKVDGNIGPKTIKAILNIEDPLPIANRLNAIRLIDMAKMKTFSAFGRGWVARVAQNILDINEVKND